MDGLGFCSYSSYTNGLPHLKGLLTERSHVRLAQENVVPSESEVFCRGKQFPDIQFAWLSGLAFCFPRNTLVGWFLLCYLPWNGQHGTLSNKCWFSIFFFFVFLITIYLISGEIGSMSLSGYLIAITDLRKIDSSGCVVFVSVEASCDISLLSLYLMSQWSFSR